MAFSGRTTPFTVLRNVEGCGMRSRLFTAVVAILVFAAAQWVSAQFVAVRPVPPSVVFGEDVGFRIDGDRAGTPVGTIVVKQDGTWVAAELGSVKPTGRVSQR